MARTVGRWDLNVATKTSFRNFLQSEGMPNSATGRANSDQGLPTHYKGSVRHPLRQNKCPARGIFFAERSEVPADLASPRLCERLGYTIVQEYTDSGISGAKVVMTDLLQTLSRKILLVVALTW